MPYVYPYNLSGTLLKQAVGKSTSGLPHVQTKKTRDVQANAVQCAFELQTPARNESGFRIVQQADLG